MCGRYTVHGQPATESEWRLHIARVMRITDMGQVEGTLFYDRYNVAPRQEVPVVERSEDGGRRLKTARWGLLPAWAKTSKDRLQPINARDDKLDGPMWCPLMEPRQRVLLLADGYYEWVKAEKPSEKPAPFYHQVDDGQLFAFAGFQNTTRVDDLEEPITTTAMITTAANRTAARVHDRMPAILADEEAIDAWLSPDVSAEDARALIAPLEDSRLTVRPVSKLVNNANNEGAELLAPEGALVD